MGHKGKHLRDFAETLRILGGRKVVTEMLGVAYGAAWSFLLGPFVPRTLMYAFEPSLFLVCMILAGLWLGRFFVILGLVGLALMAVGYAEPEPWLRLWMAVAQSGTLVLGGVWLYRQGVER